MNKFEMSLITTKWYLANFKKADNYWSFPWAFEGVGLGRLDFLSFFFFFLSLEKKKLVSQMLCLRLQQPAWAARIKQE